MPHLLSHLDARARIALAAEGPARADTFRHRLQRWGPDLLQGLGVYARAAAPSDAPGDPTDPTGHAAATGDATPGPEGEAAPRPGGEAAPRPDGESRSVPTELAHRVLDLIMGGYSRRRPCLRELDEQRLLRPDWFAGPDQVGYVCYADRFADTISGVAKRIGYLRELGVTYLHLMPLLRPRDGVDDGGYAVADYRQVRADLGTIDDLADLADALHDHGIALTLDLVLNHVAREHEWARSAIAGDAHYQRYFHLFADRRLPDRYERSLPQVFPDTAPGTFTWVPELLLTGPDGTPADQAPGPRTPDHPTPDHPTPDHPTPDHPTPGHPTPDGHTLGAPASGRRGAWVWTTFHDYQWDLDWSNPDVFCELLDVVLTLANVGVDCLRLDAIAFLWKRLGTTCQNLPEVHLIVQALRAAVRIAAPAVIFKAEAIVAPEELPAYLGRGRHAGKVCDLAYHNSLMVQLWSAIAAGRADLARHALAVPPPKPVTTAWGTYARCHDDIGWAISDADAAAVGLSGAAHRAWLADFYAGRTPGSFARGEDFQVDPRTGDRRTCGTLASLAGLEVGLQVAAETGDTTEADRALGRIFLLHAVVYGFGGIPLLYMGDELGLRNDRSYLADRRFAEDNRWLHRPAMPWDVAERRFDPASVEGRVFAGIRHLGRVRAGLASLHAAVESQPVDAGNGSVLALVRRHPAGVLLQLYNVSRDWQHVPAHVLRDAGIHRPWDHISSFAPGREGSASGAPDVSGDDGWYAIPPYAAWWLGDRPDVS